MSLELNRCLIGDCRAVLPTLPDATFACCVTSPPYWGLRDYGHAAQIGLEPSPDAYVAEIVQVFREVRRVLREDGTLWLNLGDSYANDGKWGGSTGGKHVAALHGASGIGRGRKCTSLKPKDLVGIPWRVAFALQADGWYLRSDIIWHKPNPMPESVTDRPTKAHEYVFLLSKRERYWFDADAVREEFSALTEWTYPQPDKAARNRQSTNGTGATGLRVQRHSGRNVRSVWPVATTPYDGAHFATMPPKLVERRVLAGCPLGGAVLDPFFGSGTVGQVAEQLGRKWLGIELNPAYAKLIAERTAQSGLVFEETPA